MAKNEVHVVLIEDNPTFSEAIERILDDDPRTQFSVTRYEDAETALTKLETTEVPVDLFIVDLKLSSDTSGYDFLKKAQERRLFPGAPRMVVTDLSRSHLSLSGRILTMQNLTEVGVVGFLEKRDVWLKPDGGAFIESVNKLIEVPYTEVSFTEVPVAEGTDPLRVFFQSGVYLGMTGGALSILGSLANRSEFVNGSLGLVALGTALIAVAVTAKRKTLA